MHCSTFNADFFSHSSRNNFNKRKSHSITFTKFTPVDFGKQFFFIVYFLCSDEKVLHIWNYWLLMLSFNFNKFTIVHKKYLCREFYFIYFDENFNSIGWTFHLKDDCISGFWKNKKNLIRWTTFDPIDKLWKTIKWFAPLFRSITCNTSATINQWKTSLWIRAALNVGSRKNDTDIALKWWWWSIEISILNYCKQI